MEVISSIDLIKCNKDMAKSVFFGTNRIQLKVESKSEFDSLMNSEYADLIYANRERIVSLRGPITSTPDSSVFEDTALIISHLEDNLDVTLQYITALPGRDGKHITELGDFFQDTISIFASTVPFVEDSQFRTPYGISDFISSTYHAGKSYDKMAYMGISYDVHNLNPVWLDTEVCYTIVDFIDEVYINQINGLGVGKVVAWLAQLKEMGCTPYVTYDSSSLLSGSDIIERLIQGV